MLACLAIALLFFLCAVSRALLSRNEVEVGHGHADCTFTVMCRFFLQLALCMVKIRDSMFSTTCWACAPWTFPRASHVQAGGRGGEAAVRPREQRCRCNQRNVESAVHSASPSKGYSFHIYG